MQLYYQKLYYLRLVRPFIVQGYNGKVEYIQG